MSPSTLPLGRVIATLGAVFVLNTAAAGVESQGRATAPADQTQAPRGADSIRFAVIGDIGTGERRNTRSGPRSHARSRCSRSSSCSCSATTSTAASGRRTSCRSSRSPTRPCSTRKIPFYAALGNHDDPNQRFYKPFNMNGERFYTFEKDDVRFFALDSNYMDKAQQDWLEKELSGVERRSGRSLSSTIRSIRRARRTARRWTCARSSSRCSSSTAWTWCFAGHEHFYERLKPQKGMHYFTSGAAGEAAGGQHPRRRPLTAKGFDIGPLVHAGRDRRTTMHFQTLSRHGKLVDSVAPSARTTSQADRRSGPVSPPMMAGDDSAHRRFVIAARPRS